MVSFLTGFPGSGKSYYAIDKIYNILIGKDNLSKNIEVIYTNINGVKFDKFPDSKIKFKKLIIEDLYKYLTQCYTLYKLHKNEDNVDDYLVEFSKKEGYHNAFIVFDECHDFFTPQDMIKIFWLTYHRHLYHEILLLTQNKSLIHSKYRAIPEIFIEAQPRSKKISSKTLTYKSYASFAMRKADMFNKFSIKTKDEVFILYQSGNKSHQKSIIVKFIALALIALVIVALFFWYLISSHMPKPKPKQEDIKPNVSKSREFKAPSNYYVISMLCDRQLGCIYNGVTYPNSHINKFILSSNSKILYKKNIYFDFESKTRIYKQFIYTSKDDLKKFFLLPKEEKRKSKFEEINSKNISSGIRL